VATVHSADEIARLLEVSNERDLQLRLRLALGRWMYRAGWSDGYAAGRRDEAADRDAAWHAAAAPIAAAGGLERRRWGPGGRRRFGDPRPGDYPGRAA
jgi:hypothetical protein